MPLITEANLPRLVLGLIIGLLIGCLLVAILIQLFGGH